VGNHGNVPLNCGTQRLPNASKAAAATKYTSSSDER
jgi:hypothetical protein